MGPEFPVAASPRECPKAATGPGLRPQAHLANVGNAKAPG